MTKTRSVLAQRLLVAVITFSLFVFYIVMHNSSWVFDDNFNLVFAGQEGFTWHWLTSVQFEHWNIALRAVFSLQHRLFFFDYRWGLALLLVMLGTAIYLFERTLAMLVSNRWVTLAVSVWFGFNILWARPLQWWMAGMQYLPYTLLDLLCLYGFLRWSIDRRGRWAAISIGALVGGLFFYEKPAYMLFYLFLLRVLLMSKNLSPRAVLADIWRERVIWLGYLAVIALWGAGYISSNAYSSHGSIPVGQYVTYFRILWLQTLVPSLASVTIPASNLDDLQLLFVVVSQAAVLVCVVYSLRRQWSAWRAWTFMVIVILGNGILVAHSRVPIFGVDIANDPRYLMDYTWLAPLVLCAAFSPGGVLRPSTGKPSKRLLFSWGSPGTPIVCALLTLYVAGSIASAVHVEKIWAGPQGREWETRLRRGIAAQERQGVKPMVAENATPFVIMAGFVAPYNRLSRVLPMYVGPIQVDGPLDAPLVRIAENGTVHRVGLSPVPGDASLMGLINRHQATVGAGRMVNRGDEVCVIADSTQVPVEWRLTTTPDVARAPYYLKLSYRVWQPVTLPLYIDSGAGFPGITDHYIALSPIVKWSIGWLGSGAPHRMLLTLPPLTTVCLGSFDVVSLHDLS